VLLGVETSDARSTWAWKRKCQVSLANWMQFGCKLLGVEKSDARSTWAWKKKMPGVTC
ncbi:hypothetical protein Tco_0326037, partial [Tanacetum coccineum]